VVAGVTVGLDQLTKAAARAWLAPRPPITLLGGVVRLAHSQNVGAFMGMGSALPPLWRTLLFGVFAGVLLIGVAAYVFAAPDLVPSDVAAASLLVGGGLGNLIDRITQQGIVTDFLNVGIGRLRTGVFNVADLAIVLGVLGMTIPLWRAALQDVE
jgi:signal peptidase II